MISLFDIADVNQSASAFNPEKLLWLNQQHIINAPAETLGKQLSSFLAKLEIDTSNGPATELVADVYRERAETIEQMAVSCLYCYKDFDEIDPKSAKKQLRPVILEPMRTIRERFAKLEEW